MDSPEVKRWVVILFFVIVVALPILMLIGLWLFGIWGAVAAFVLVVLGSAVALGMMWSYMAAIDKKRLKQTQSMRPKPWSHELDDNDEERNQAN